MLEELVLELQVILMNQKFQIEDLTMRVAMLENPDPPRAPSGPQRHSGGRHGSDNLCPCPYCSEGRCAIREDLERRVGVDERS